MKCDWKTIARAETRFFIRTNLVDIRTTTTLDPMEKILGMKRVATAVNESKGPGIIKACRNVE
ncbi:hypothetical protein BGZ79_003929, partial [Entomortierella chlamydospora]